MKITVYSTVGEVKIKNLPEADALDLVSDLQESAGTPFLVLDLDEKTTVYLARKHVVRVDLDDDKRV